MNHDCFVIGSGPSLEGFDFARLPPAYRIGANKSAWLADCDCLVTIDPKFHREFRDEIMRFQGERFVARAEGERIDGVAYIEHGRGKGMAGPGMVHGLNSGYAALNVAFHKGFKRVGLLGMDFQWVQGRSHFHDGYAWQNKNTHRFLGRWAVEFRDAFDQLADAGMEVVNYVGPSGSGITCFEKRPLTDLIQ